MSKPDFRQFTFQRFTFLHVDNLSSLDISKAYFYSLSTHTMHQVFYLPSSVVSRQSSLNQHVLPITTIPHPITLRHTLKMHGENMTDQWKWFDNIYYPTEELKRERINLLLSTKTFTPPQPKLCSRSTSSSSESSDTSSSSRHIVDPCREEDHDCHKMRF